MKKSAFLLLQIVLLQLCSAQASLDSLRLRWQRFGLPNGLQVLLQPDTAAADVSVEFWLATGASDEAEGMHGATHFFEHATPYGLSKDTAAFSRLRAGMVNSNAQTRRDYTRYFLQVKPAVIDLALRYAAERLKADTALITPAVVERHRVNVLNEMRRQEANPFYGPAVSGARAKAAFGAASPYGHGTYGTLANNQRFTADDVKQWYAKTVFAGNVSLFLAGNFDPQAARRLIETYFSTGLRSGERKKQTLVAVTPKEQRTRLSAPVSEHTVSLTWAVPGYGNPHEAALRLLSFMAEEILRQEKPAFVSAAGAQQLFFMDELAGQFGVFASFPTAADSSAAAAFLHQTVERLLSTKAGPEMVERAKQKLLEEAAENRKELGFADSRTELLGEGLVLASDPDHYFKTLQSIRSLAPGDVQKVARQQLRGKGAFVLLLSNK